MKKFILLSSILFYSAIVFANGRSDEPENTIPKLQNDETLEDNARFKLYPTSNIWTFIKLDTRYGRITQVHFDINGDSRAELSINSRVLLPYDESWAKANNGRFKLYSTQNMYTFLLLDQIDGRMWQVQWSLKEKQRGIVYDYQLGR